jgi:hypothetical protein
MKRHFRWFNVLATFAVMTASAIVLRAASGDTSTDRTISTIVTVTGPQRVATPELTRDDVRVYRDHERLPVMGFTPFQRDRAGLDLVILFDDSLETNFIQQLGDLTDFIRALPATTRVAVAYIRNSMFTMGQDFTKDRELVVKVLRAPLGSPREFSSPYLSLVDLIQGLPQDDNRHAILMISDGVDRFRGPFEPVSPDLEPAYQEAQRKGIPIYAIYVSGVGGVTRNSYPILNGQGSLSRLAGETGGEAFFGGFTAPVSLKPCLQELGQMLQHQYLVSFRVRPDEEDSYQHFKFATQVPNVELIAPEHIFVPGAR